MSSKFVTFVGFLLVYNCAVLHNYTLGEIDNRSANKKPFQILVSQTGFKLEEGISLAQAGLASKGGHANDQSIRELEFAKLIIELSTMGPVTGGKVLNDKYADEIPKLIYERCPSGNITGLRSIRETAHYPVISGEIVKIEGFCIE
ncbi:hypothetical protein EHQ12_10495 [Leptospira gomenensis]|uniref:Uncharacterized protein n=1 Tax=Leptospira gomenensis TaxID=2484974 RepID=A0A5F1YZN4_9LEPT|nr:hypothetical protein [Leptospira gomenensis]TGK36452.1 hypothetical protein EHQ17_04060 [Leptospira gomenensis]TGK38281.1 hypothetical protein EHQ12_10495 [Leptospira gomenensis]TGK46022.1 hypothetical protein EHQ07_07620 [Leptospira gomenensis]TGK65286.1 hypothetical protein EHQ13_05425 [Leptospira gomenensis]